MAKTPMNDDTRRIERVAGVVRAHVTELLHELGDAVLASAVVTSVEVSKDLSVARILVRSLEATDDPERRRKFLQRLKKATPHLRREVGPRLGLRRVPELRFEFDTGRDASNRVAELLAEIAREPKGK